jgi:hypothetical protein
MIQGHVSFEWKASIARKRPNNSHNRVVRDFVNDVDEAVERLQGVKSSSTL